MIEYPKDFIEFWKLYPRCVAKLTALKAYKNALKLGAGHAEIIRGVAKYAEYCIGKDEQYIKHPSTWLNGGCWEDEYGTRENKSSWASEAERLAEKYRREQAAVDAARQGEPYASPEPGLCLAAPVREDLGRA